MSWPPPNYRPDYGSGYKISLRDFRQLVSDPSWQQTTGRLLRDWFGYEIVGERSEATVRSAEGGAIDLSQLHSAIQADPQKQYQLYQAAMDLWR
jgi:hypothetical protein